MDERIFQGFVIENLTIPLLVSAGNFITGGYVQAGFCLTCKYSSLTYFFDRSSMFHCFCAKGLLVKCAVLSTTWVTRR